MKVGTSNQNLINYDMKNEASSRSAQLGVGGRRKTSVQKLSAKELLGQNGSYGEQVEVHFETKEQEAESPKKYG